MKYQTIIDRMTLEEKIALCSGADFFTTRAFQPYDIPGITMVDGPHGLRKPVAAADQLGINRSFPATCFPTASLTACSWDRQLLREMGAAIAEEALQEGVSIVLGPGANIKRNPLCGRNFEYFSEDPFLAGEMAASWIDGLQSKGVGASLKHFAANSQENERMSSDSIVDERTLREIYLPAFEIAVKRAKPATVMCAYNKLNGVYCSDHARLLRNILRDEWGFAGVVVTDWGAMNDRVKAFEAGLDLEMPGSKGYFDQEVIAAIHSGHLAEARLDESVSRLLELIFSVANNPKEGVRFDADSHHSLAKRIAVNSAVLLKNDGQLLPIAPGKKIALIGAFASEPRYQGAGSSHINSSKLSSAIDGFEALGLDFAYYPGYALKGPPQESLLADAITGAQHSDVAVIFAGLPEAYESEGFDRTNLAMPDSHNRLISRVAAANPNTVVVLMAGAPVEMPWLPEVKTVLHMYLSGQAGGLAVAELLTGIANPGGKLAESYPICYADMPSAGFYETGGKQAQYREGIYVGYRYYNKARKDVLFPFGHGLSYTTFEYSDLSLSHTQLDSPYKLNLSVTVRNTGSVDGAEILQVYVSQLDPPMFRAEKELKEFKKVLLKAGEAERVNFTLDARAFAVFDTQACDWVVPGGIYKVLVGASSRDIRLGAEVSVRGAAASSESRAVSGWYFNPAGEVTQEDFESLLGRKIEPVKPWRKGEYTLACSFQDMQDRFIVRQIIKGIEKSIAKSFGGADYTNPTFKMIMSSSTSTPLKNLSQLSPGSMPRHITEGIVHLANGRFLKGLVAMLKK
ncbi:MAG TPA: glycoside hydrolase family 3 C-terminal domain-containing protein [Levilinea sp.]|nr:glycoside hydrolase family 3 C-terminal domain-containing protein [Levilinea sp.]